MNLLKTISKKLLVGLLTIGIFVSGVSVVDAIYNPAAQGTYALQSSVGSADTTIRLSSFKDPRNGLAITMAYLNTDIAYATLDPQSTRSEIVSFTGVTQNSDGTASVTGVTRGLAGVSPFTASSTLRKSHAGQSYFILSDAPQVFVEYAAKRNAQSISGIWTFSTTTIPTLDGFATSSGNQLATAAWVQNLIATGFLYVSTSTSQTITGPLVFSGITTFNASTTHNGTTTITKPLYLSSGFITTTPTTPLEIVNKAYADALAIAGSPNASTTAKGIVQEATAAEALAGTAIGSTGARLFLNPSTTPPPIVGGDGSDGALATTSSTISLTRDMYYTDLTVSGTAIINTNGFKIFATGTISVDGTSGARIQNNGGAGGNAVTTTPGAAGAATAVGSLPAGSVGVIGGTAGSTGTVGVSVTVSAGVSGVSGGAGGQSPGAGIGGGAAGGGSGTATVASTLPRSFANAQNPFTWTSSTATSRVLGSAGSGSGGGGTTNGGVGGAGGGSGASGGWIYLECKYLVITGAGAITAAGGAGGNGGAASGGSGGGGAGSGGPGGVIAAVYLRKSGTGTMTVPGGAGGAGGAGAGGTGGTGVAGTTGTTGIIYEITR